MPTTIIELDLIAKKIRYGNQTHAIGEHLSNFVNSNYDLFQKYRGPVYGVYEKLNNLYLVPQQELFSKINELFKELFFVCFSDLFLENQGIKSEHKFMKQAHKLFTPSRRFLYFLSKNKDFISELDISYEINYGWYSKLISSLSSKDNSTSDLTSILKDDPDTINKDFISILNIEPKYIEYISVKNYQSFLFYEFQKIIQLNIPVKQCKNCGLYFVPSGRPDSIYCDNIDKETGKTCLEIGSTNVYKRNISGSKIHEIYNRTYKRMYARRTNRKISPKDFETWLNAARVERDKAIENNTSPDEFTEAISKLEVHN
ncbi:DUF6076 domain-containing protein [Desulfosporosinus sp. SB140]|uniref:DUF6076 domain-containing protein n=1 Tax=Desulfosporosinus paludis TaxID=3115649 RepID=UPI00388D363D